MRHTAMGSYAKGSTSKSGTNSAADGGGSNAAAGSWMSEDEYTSHSPTFDGRRQSFDLEDEVVTFRCDITH